MLAPVLINAVYASIAFGFSYVFEQASLKKREGLPDVSYIHEQLMQYAAKDESILDNVIMLADNEIGMLKHDHFTSMTNQAQKEIFEARGKIAAATDCQTVLAIYKKLDALMLSENKEIDEEIKMALKTSEGQCLDFMERDPLKKMTNLVVKRINPQLKASSFNHFSAELKTRLAQKEEEDIHYISQFGLAVKLLNEETKALSHGYDQYKLPTLKTRSIPRPLKMACFNKMSEIQQEVLAGLANPDTAEEVRKAVPAKRRELSNYLIMAETVMSIEANDRVEHAVTDILALNKKDERESSVEKKLDRMLAASDVTSYECHELLSLRAEKLRSEMVGLYSQVNEQYADMKETWLIKVAGKIEQQDKLLDLQASMDLAVETLEHFSMMGRDIGMIQEDHEGLAQVKELQALRDTAYSFHKKFWYAFEEAKTVMSQKATMPQAASHEHANFDALNSAMGSFLSSTRQTKAWAASFKEDKQNEKVDKLIDAIRQTALARLQVKRLFRTGEVLKLYQRAASISEPHLDSGNLNEFIKEMTRFQKWSKWGLGGVVTMVKTDEGEQKYRLPHGIALMWQTIQAFGVVYNPAEKCFELSSSDKERESESESRGRNDLHKNSL